MIFASPLTLHACIEICGERGVVSVEVPYAYHDVRPLQALAMLQFEGCEACQGCYGQQPRPTQALTPCTSDNAEILHQTSQGDKITTMISKNSYCLKEKTEEKKVSYRHNITTCIWLPVHMPESPFPTFNATKLFCQECQQQLLQSCLRCRLYAKLILSS